MPKINIDGKEVELNFLKIANESVVVNFLGETYSIKNGDMRYEDVVKALSEGRFEEVPNLSRSIGNSLVDKEKGMEFKDNNVFIDGEMIPEQLAERILEYKRQNLPYDSLANFARKLRSNPSFNSRLMLFKFLENNGHPFTDEGNFIAYRRVTENFKDFHTKRMDNSVGAICSMPREKVDDNPNNLCSSGLHVASWEYPSQYFGSGGHLIEVEVDPADVVAVPTDYNGKKMRVCKFKVLNVVTSERDEVLYNQSRFQDDFEDEYEDEDEDDCDACYYCGQEID